MGPSLDAVSRKPIFRHSVLDNEGIVFTGAKVMPRQVYFVRIFDNNSFIPE